MDTTARSRDDSRAELHRLCDLCLYDAASEDEQRQLETLISASPQAVNDYWQCVVDSVNLRLLATADLNSSPASAGVFLVDAAILEQLQRSSSDTDICISDRGRSGDSVKSVPLFGRIARGLELRRHPVRFAAASLAVVGAFWSFWAFLIEAEWNDHLNRSRNSASISVATLYSTEDCNWASPEKSFAKGDSIRLGEALRIASGCMELELKRGVHITVEGPAEFEIRSSNSGFLRVGKLTAEVPAQAIGFTVSTPRASVVDLGTEFGVEVGEDGETAVHVFQGIVEVSPTTLKDSKSEQLAHSSTQRLRAGEAARVDAGVSAVVMADFVPDKFRRPATSPTKPSPHSRQTILVDLKSASSTQSSELKSNDFPAPLALDGDPQTFSHTGVDDDAAWWQVDMGSTRSIAVVVLNNREKHGQGWLRDVTVTVIAEDGKTVTASSPRLNPKNALGGGEHDFDIGPSQLAFDLLQTRGKPVAGRFVRIERAPCAVDRTRMKIADRREEAVIACGNTLVLGEVQVFETEVLSDQTLPHGDRR